MKSTQAIPGRIFLQNELMQQVKRWRLLNKRIVFTNGVFDILHTGHITLLDEAARSGDVLVVALNTDASVKRLKGAERPVNDEQSRALIMASLIMVDAVILFDEDTPQHLISLLKPDVLVKGGDYTIETIVGASEVIDAGGEVRIVPVVEGFSTTATIERMRRYPEN